VESILFSVASFLSSVTSFLSSVTSFLSSGQMNVFFFFVLSLEEEAFPASRDKVVMRS